MLSTAVKVARRVVVGLATGPLLANKRHGDLIQSFEVRKEAVLGFVAKVTGTKPGEIAEVVPLTDPYGPTTTSEEIEVLVLSEETYPVASEINELRRKKGLKPLVLVVVPLLRDSAGKKLSSTGIRERLSRETGP